MKAPRDLLTIKLQAARKRRDAALKQVALADAEIEDLLARKTARHTRELRRNAHRPVRLNRTERAIADFLAQEACL